MSAERSAKKPPMTPAVRALKAAKAPHRLLTYDYVDKGGTAEAARQLGLEHHRVIKTLVMAAADKTPLIILMHGDREVSTKALARQIGQKSVVPVDPARALRLTGYQVGGISPFGIKQTLPIYAEASILELDSLVINAGKRGLLAEIAAADLVRILNPTPVSAAI